MAMMSFANIFCCMMVFGSRSITEANDAHTSDKVLTRTLPVDLKSADFVTASKPDAEFGLLAGRTLPRNFFWEPLGSSLVFSSDQSLESERHQDSMHGCVRLNESDKTKVEPKYQNHELMFQPRSDEIVKAAQSEKTKIESKYQNHRLMFQPISDDKIDIVKAAQSDKITVESKNQSHKLMFPSYRQEMVEPISCLLFGYDRSQNLEMFGSTEEYINEEPTPEQSCFQEMWQLKAKECRNDEGVDVFVDSILIRE